MERCTMKQSYDGCSVSISKCLHGLRPSAFGWEKLREADDGSSDMFFVSFHVSGPSFFQKVVPVPF